MGCVIEFLIEFFVELFLEIILYGWFALMQLIVPKRYFNDRFERIVKIIVGIITALLFIGMIIGLIFMFVDDIGLQDLGFYIFIVALGVSIAQIIAGIIVRILVKKEK